MIKKSVLIWAGFAIGFIACSTSETYISERMKTRDLPTAPPDTELAYSVFLLGDGGEAKPNPTEPVLALLKLKSREAGEKSAVVFLGDNIYPSGLPPEDDPGRKGAEESIRAQLEAVREYPGRVFFIPGNHDWNQSRRGGLETLKRQEDFIEGYLDRGNIFLPDDGFPGPVDIELVDDDDTDFDKDIRLIILDTEWWLTEQKKPFGDTGEYELQDAGDFLVELRDVMRERQNDHVIIAAHHPLYSNGSHGGHFPLITHFTPPLFGTMYVLYRKFFGFSQDISHYRYQELKRELTELFSQKMGLVYASGHQHSLQFFNQTGKRLDQHFIVSGSASRVDYTATGMGADFTHSGQGFMVIRYYNDGSAWLEAWTPGENEKAGSRIFRTRIIEPSEDPFYQVEEDSVTGPYPDYGDSTVTMPANPGYDEPGPVFRALMGSHNRDLWSIPVEVPVFDISTVEGGLEAVKLGGVGQSNTLRLKNSEGNEFVLRSVDKVAGKTWEEHLKNTLAHDLAQDQFSILNPYGAFMIPPLADAAGIFHTNPKLFYIPDDPRLGEFANQAAGQLALFEERPDDDMSHALHFGGSGEVTSSRDMLSEVEGDLDHQVDQKLMLRNRLFDMWISDWDRHEDQWRWASFEPFELDSTLVGDARTEGKIYQPIPRDRDTAFMFMNGIIPTIGKLSVFRSYQDFRESYGNIKGLTQNSLALTRRFTNELSRSEWIDIANQLKEALTDQVIARAVEQLPENVRRNKGEKIARLMKVRRDQLPDISEQYYELLNRVVDVVGSHKEEYFQVIQPNREQTVVRVYKKSEGENGDRAYYDRTFLSSETKEIRIYGLGGDDNFEIDAAGGNKTLIRIVGGSGMDRFDGSGTTAAAGNRVKLYDSAGGNQWVEVESLNIHTSDRASDHMYDYKRGYGYNFSEPILFFGHNNDDGVFAGGGVLFNIRGFRKYPYAATHRIRVNVAARTGAFNIRYSGEFTDITGLWDGALEMHALTPNNIRNFLGLGNETKETIGNDDYYKARLWQYRVAPSLKRRLGTGLSFSMGPFFQVTEVREDEGRFISQPQAGVSENTFEDQWFTGVETELALSSLDNSINPRQGFKWSNEAALNLGVRNTSDNHTRLSSAVSIYLSPSLSPQLTVATRVGVQHTIGSFPFYKANALGGNRNLRGLRSTRYNGRTSFFNNIELRSKLFDFSSYLLGGEFGLMGFLDHGRVWTDGENSDQWHAGYGGGAWVSIFEMTVIRGSIGFSENEWNVLIGAGFFF